MASDTASKSTEEAAERTPRWSGPWTLTYRILAVNLITLGLAALGILYLDSFRDRLTGERIARMEAEAAIVAGALEVAGPAEGGVLLAAIARTSDRRLRLYDRGGKLLADSRRWTGPTYRLRDPALQGWTKEAARTLDRGFNLLVGARPAEDFIEPERDSLSAWPEAMAAAQTGRVHSDYRNAPDLTPVWSAAAPAGPDRVLLLTHNDREFTRTIRSERQALAIALAVAAILSILLSLFLARTIVDPLRRLALAANRVRLGRAREVKVPRLPARRDEIGMLARALADMSQALRQRMDKIEAFAADVAHELKNPLASLRSALDGLDRVEDPHLRGQLLDVARDDVLRLDRLIGDISEAARTDAELSRARFEPVDIGKLLAQLVQSWETRREKGSARIAFARPRRGTAVCMGEPGRIARAIDNIIDNAISFSPPGGLVEVSASRVGGTVLVRVDDEGPGVPQEAREAIFNRFHSVRPEHETFGRHSGLGLAIARAIVEGHDGEIDVQDRDDAPSGARFIIRLPAADRQ
jgi:two-component system, OmpR family, sensor histidine kinase ChvG